MKQLLHIGTTTLVSLPDEPIQNVPAKIDTGADSSAIWASNITEKDNQLSFRLFDKSSTFYSGKEHECDAYEVISVKNSFGQSELRYKVKLRLAIGGKLIRAKFTLANRAGSRYPILIGRKTLYGKFLVDVTKRPAKTELNILMLSTKRTVVTQEFANNVQKSGKNLKVTYAAYEDLRYQVGAPANKISLINNNRDIASFDLVHFKTTSRLMDVAAAIARYQEQRNVPFVDQAIKNSFGQSELRYKVKLRLAIGGKLIRAKFTLANRAGSRYPILIGRKTLYGKFLVDVTKRPAKTELNILMLSTKRTVVTQEFANNVQKSGKNLKVTYAAYEDLRYQVGAPANKISLINNNRDIASFDLVHFKTTSRLMDVAAAIARYQEQRNVPFVDQAIKHFPSTSKLYQYVMLQDNEIAVPKSIFMLPDVLAGSFDFIKNQLGLPFILKDIHGNKGEHNYLIKNQTGFNEAVVQAAQDEVQLLAQAGHGRCASYRRRR